MWLRLSALWSAWPWGVHERVRRRFSCNTNSLQCRYITTSHLWATVWAVGRGVDGGKMRFARIALAYGFLCSTESARDMEHMSTGSGHAYNEYKSYAGPVRSLTFSQTPHTAPDRCERSREPRHALRAALMRRDSGTDLAAAWAAASTALLTACGDQ